jgi:hypothetical protein
VLTVAASVAPFFIGMLSEAAMDMHAERAHPVDQSDVVSDVTPDVQDAGDTAHYGAYKPAGSTSYTPVKVAASPTITQPNAYVGKHRKVAAAAVTKAAKTPETPASKDAPKPSKHHPKHHPKRKPHTPAEAVVNDVLTPLETLLK